MSLNLQYICTALLSLFLELNVFLRRFQAELDLDVLDVFEQQASFGGVWNYTDDPKGCIDVPQTDPNQPLEKPIWDSNKGENAYVNGGGEANATFTSPMYEQLETNIPHVLMKFSDESSLETHQLFPSRQAVTQYLEEYAEPSRSLVRFQTQVIDVRPRHQTLRHGWLLQYKDLRSGAHFEETYDAVLVASGHYTVPTLPNIKGIKSWDTANKGTIYHSKFYRRPDPFAKKKVIVVGNSASGIDIASQIAKVSKHPLLNSTRSESPLSYEAEYKENVPQIEEFLPPDQGTRAVRFSDGRVEENVDAILFCTGYYYSFPFLSSIAPALISTGERVQNLYKHIFYAPDPTLAFLGLPFKIIPFRTLQGQAAIVARVWSDRLVLPSQGEMRRWEESVVAERGSGKPFHVLPFPRDFEYHNNLIDWAINAKTGAVGQLPPKWNAKETWLRERFPAIKKAFADRGEERRKVRTVEELGFDYEKWLQENQGVQDKE